VTLIRELLFLFGIIILAVLLLLLLLLFLGLLVVVNCNFQVFFSDIISFLFEEGKF